MKKNIILATLLSMSLQYVNAQCPLSPWSFYTFNYGGHSYEIVKQTSTWDEAASCAVLRGGHLVRIDSEQEGAYLLDQITDPTKGNIPSNYRPVIDGGGASYIWTGGTDKDLEGSWKWHGSDVDDVFYKGEGTAGDGTGVALNGAYVNWGNKNTSNPDKTSEPDNFLYLNDQDGLGLSLGSWPYGVSGQWNDIDQANKLFYVIEKDLVTGWNNSNNDESVALYSISPESMLLKVYPSLIGRAFTITNALGKPVYEGTLKSNETSINAETLSAGMYLLYIEGHHSVIKFSK